MKKEEIFNILTGKNDEVKSWYNYHSFSDWIETYYNDGEILNSNFKVLWEENWGDGNEHYLAFKIDEDEYNDIIFLLRGTHRKPFTNWTRLTFGKKVEKREKRFRPLSDSELEKELNRIRKDFPNWKGIKDIELNKFDIIEDDYNNYKVDELWSIDWGDGGRLLEAIKYYDKYYDKYINNGEYPDVIFYLEGIYSSYSDIKYNLITLGEEYEHREFVYEECEHKEVIRKIKIKDLGL